MSIRSRFKAIAGPLAFISACTAPARAVEKAEFWPGASYDETVPSFESLLGHAPGERIVSHAEILRYLEALAEARPKQIKLYEYAESWEHRKLVYVVIGSEENIAHLSAIRSDLQRLAEPRGLGDDAAREIVARVPASTWLAYGVHGNEISSPDAGLLTAYHLLAARNDAIVDVILENSLVIIVPTQNPDGRDRFVNHFRIAEGIVPDAHPSAAEHIEPWPGGRTNHYYFDLNRDWLAITQPETSGHIKALLDWFPQVFVDLHEMGGNSTYYFTPEAVPYNPHITSAQKESLDLYGRNNAKWFDEFGFLYFTREVYDAFYPGYGASWPLFQGTNAATYEQASARGLVFRRNDGTDLEFRDGVRHHFVSSIATAETTARNREQLLMDFYRYRKTAVQEGQSESTRAYIFPNEGDRSTVRKLVGILVEQGIEVSSARTGFRACGQEFPAGSFVVSTAQPAKRLIRTILDEQVSMEDEFLAEQERRRQKKLADEIYDVTGWSLPLMFNVRCLPCSEVPTVDLEPSGPERIEPTTLTGPAAKVAYLVPWGTAAAGRLLAAALSSDLRVLSADKTIQQNGRTYPRGTLIFMVKHNPTDLRETMAELARRTGAEVVATDTGWVDGGINFGSNNVQHVRRPRVAMAWDAPTSASAAGSTRFVLERQFGYPVTPIRSATLARASSTLDLSPFDVLILPEGNYTRVFDEPATARFKEWIEGGGTLIGLGTALGYLIDSELLASKRENEAKADGEEKKPKEESEARLFDSESDYLKAIEPQTQRPDSLAGVLVRAKLDPEHWLTAGMNDSVTVLVRGNAIYSPLTLDKGQNPAIFAGADELMVSGYIWKENRKQLAYKPLTMVQPLGRGLVIGFTADPNYRAYLDGMNLLFLNAVFRGPARARPQVMMR